MKVQYFLIGETLQNYDGSNKMEMVKPDTKKGLYCDQAKTSDELQEKLIGICNKIFKRDELKDSLFGKSLSIDISMKSLIVFVQGEGAEIVSLTNDNGEKIEPLSNSKQRKYSEYSRPKREGEDRFDAYGTDLTPLTDTTLYGQVVTFGECVDGSYTLDIKGADKDKIKIFYEPDVDMQVDITDLEGNAVDIDDGSILGGDYIVKAKLIDAKTGKDITKSPLMGNNVKFEIGVSENGKNPVVQSLDVEKGSVVTLAPGKGVNTVITGTYLKDYTISNKDDPTIFPNTFDVIDPEDGLSVKAEVLQENKWYKLSKNKSWKPIRVELSIDGAPLTDEQLLATSFDFKADCGNEEKNKSLVYKVEPIEGESAVNVYLAKDSKGKYKAPASGDYDLTIIASTLANTGETISSNGKVSFQIRVLSIAEIVGISIAAVLLFLLLLFLYYNQKVLPNNIELDTTAYTKEGQNIKGFKASVKYSKSGKKGKLTVSTPRTIVGSTACSATFSLVAVDKRFVKSRDRKVRIVDINSSNSMVLVDNNKFFKCGNGRFVDQAHRSAASKGEIVPIQLDTNISMVEIKSDMANLKCRLETK